MTDELPDEAKPTDKKIPVAANTGAVGTVGLELHRDQVVPRRKVFAWALWDWATQPFNTVILTFVWVPSFLTSYFFLDPALAATGVDSTGARINCDSAANTSTAYCGGLGELASSLAWGIAIAGILIALLAPVLGQRADAGGRQKLQLAIFTGLLIVAQFGLFFVDGAPKFFWVGVSLIAVGSVFGEIANVSYNALLVSIANPRNVGRISGLGWGFGYIGGILALTIVVGMILGGLLDGSSPYTFQIVGLGSAIWTLIFVIPIFVAVPEPPKLREIEQVNFFRGYVELFRSIRRLWQTSRPTFWFLLASAVYRDGLSAVFVFGTVVAGQVFGFGFTDLVIFGIVLNVVAGVSTIIAGRFDDRFGPKPVILVAIGGIVLAIFVVFFGASLGKPLFWGAGIVLAMFVGPAQAASRSFLARVTPAGYEGEIFGLYATTGRAAGWMAQLATGVFIALAASQTLYGILGIAVVLGIGFVLLWFVRPPAKLVA